MLRLPSMCARRAALALLAAAAALPATRACLNNETLSDPSVTHISFADATVRTNTLHEAGGELRFDGVGTIGITPISIVVTDASADGTYPDITDAWDDKNIDYDDKNGLTGELASINLQTVRGEADSGKGTFQFCLVDTATGNPMAAEKFVFTLYDIDRRQQSLADRPPSQERALFDAQTATAYQLWPNAADSDVGVDCEDGSAPPCGSLRTRFFSTVEGGGDDNPTDPDNLTALQMRRSVAITFENTACFEIEYDIYCPVDTGEYPDTSATQCSGPRIQGGNMIWGGMAERLVIESECVSADPLTTMPTEFPSMRPSASVMPSAHPVHLPSDAPIDLISCTRVACCFDCFCCGPGTTWSSVAGVCVLDTTSVTGDDDGQCGEADEEICYSGFECVAQACCPGGTELVVNPNYPLADRCYCRTAD